MKLCCKCKKNECRNKTSSYCKVCHNEYQKDYYKRNPSSISDSAKRHKTLVRNMVIEAKNKPCMDCNNKYPYYVMDLDHRRGVKDFNLSIAASKHRSIQKIQAEIDKCDVVCANCHRERTFNSVP